MTSTGGAAPLVSVAMKSYNHAPYVERAARSVLEQSLHDLELVVTDDGSSDGTPDIVERIADERVRLVRFSANRGPVYAMNDAVGRARGEFIAILNSDDYALPGRLERQVAYLREHLDVAAVFSVPLQVGEHEEPVAGHGDLFRVPLAHGLRTRADYLRMMFFYGNFLCAPSAMVRRAAWNEIGPDDPRLRILFDLDRWIRLLERYAIAVVDEPQTAFRRRAGERNLSGVTAEMRRRSEFEAFRIFQRYRTFDPAFLREIFAPHVATYAIDTSRPDGVWLADIATLGTRRWHALFALDTLYDAASAENDVARLLALAGVLDPFGLEQ